VDRRYSSGEDLKDNKNLKIYKIQIKNKTGKSKNG
jgi:hypothetical protein